MANSLLSASSVFYSYHCKVGQQLVHYACAFVLFNVFVYVFEENKRKRKT